MNLRLVPFIFIFIPLSEYVSEIVFFHLFWKGGWLIEMVCLTVWCGYSMKYRSSLWKHDQQFHFCGCSQVLDSPFVPNFDIFYDKSHCNGVNKTEWPHLQWLILSLLCFPNNFWCSQKCAIQTEASVMCAITFAIIYQIDCSPLLRYCCWSCLREWDTSRAFVNSKAPAFRIFLSLIYQLFSSNSH